MLHTSRSEQHRDQRSADLIAELREHIASRDTVIDRLRSDLGEAQDRAETAEQRLHTAALELTVPREQRSGPDEDVTTLVRERSAAHERDALWRFNRSDADDCPACAVSSATCPYHEGHRDGLGDHESLRERAETAENNGAFYLEERNSALTDRDDAVREQNLLQVLLDDLRRDLAEGNTGRGTGQDGVTEHAG